MLKPTKKSPEMESAIQEIFGVNRVKTILESRCPCCSGPASEFKDDLSRKEFTISGLCQECQDKVFG